MTTQKPSDRIRELMDRFDYPVGDIGGVAHDVDLLKDFVSAILAYLDEQAEKENK